MTVNATEDVQKAIYNKWTSDEWLNTNTTGLFFDEVPDDKKYPYCVFYLDSSFDHTATSKSQNYKLQFNAFSDNKSSKPINDIVAAMKRVYEAQRLILDYHVNSLAPLLSTESIHKNDLHNWQGILIFNFKVE